MKQNLKIFEGSTCLYQILGCTFYNSSYKDVNKTKRKPRLINLRTLGPTKSIFDREDLRLILAECTHIQY